MTCYEREAVCFFEHRSDSSTRKGGFNGIKMGVVGNLSVFFLRFHSSVQKGAMAGLVLFFSVLFFLVMFAPF